MDLKLHRYQEYAREKIISNPRSALFLDMGLGKTAVTLSAIDHLIYDTFEVKRVLVIAPLRVAETVWSGEVRKWDQLKQLRVSLILGTEPRRLEGLRQEADVYVINRENVSWLVKLCIQRKRWPFDMVVIDELSSFKASDSKRFRDLKKVMPSVKRVVGLTGTPAPNGYLDLWAQMYLVDQGERLGKTKTGYIDSYFKPDKLMNIGGRRIATSYKLIGGAYEEIHARLDDICVSMKSEDWLDLPDIVYNTVPVPIPMAQYDKLERDMILCGVDGDPVVADTAAALGNKLLQIANGAVYDESGSVVEVHDCKLSALADIIETTGKPVLVFYAYKHDLSRLQAYFPQAEQLTSADTIDRWNRGQIPVLLAHPGSAGHGLNLQHGGSTVVWFGLTWNLEHYQQANKRLHRPGQVERVIIHHLAAAGTIDCDILEALTNKASTQDVLLQAVKARLERWK